MFFEVKIYYKDNKLIHMANIVQVHGIIFRTSKFGFSTSFKQFILSLRELIAVDDIKNYELYQK